MAKSHDTSKSNPSIKDADTYEALRDQGASKEKAARIANAQAKPDMNPSRKGGKASPYEGWSKDDMYQRAQDIGIDGRSGMSKDQLIEALRAH